MSIGVQVTYEQAVLALKKALSELGENYVYSRVNSETGESIYAYYTKDKTPSCLVGYVLADAGVTPFEFCSDANSSSVRQLEVEGLIDFTDRDSTGFSKTRTLLCYAQVYQDTASPWGEAVSTAIELTEHGRAPGFALGPSWLP